MTTKRHFIKVSDLTIEVVRKDIKNLHLGVYPPAGRVRVAVPTRVNDEAVRLAVVSKLGWIRRQKIRFANQPRQSQREMVTGESHYFQGRRYRLRVVEENAAPRIQIGTATIRLFVRPDADAARREAVLSNWYRRELKALIPDLITKWQSVIGVQVADWGIKKMKTKWGTCNVEAKRIWLNLELAKKPPQCLEYILIHEMVHLLERHHNDHFMALMDRFMPQWRLYRDELNRAPLGHEDWNY